MIAKNKYHKYKERVEDEIASPEVSLILDNFTIFVFIQSTRF